jgi:hypothetical protein
VQWVIAWKLGYSHPDLMLQEISTIQLRQMYAYYLIDSGAYAERKKQETEAQRKTNNLVNFLNKKAEQSNGN